MAFGKQILSIYAMLNRPGSIYAMSSNYQRLDRTALVARYMITLLTYRNGITPVNPMTRLLDRTTGPWWHDLYNLIIQVLVHLHLLRFNLLLWSACQEGDGQSEHWSIDGNDQGSIVGVLYNKLNSSWPWVIKVQSDIILFHCLVTRHMISLD